MKNLIILFALTLAMGCSSKSTEKTIEVDGFASVKVDPDIVKVNIESIAEDMAYDAAATKVNTNSDKIINTLKSNGFTNLKSVSFSVEKIRDYRDEGAEKGYRARQVLSLEFPVDKESINKAINLLSDKNISSEFDFSFDLSDKRRMEAENKLVAEAVNNAKAKLDLLSKSGEFATGRILRVNYHGRERAYDMDKHVYAMAEEVAAKPNYMFAGLTISPVELNDNVDVVWEIK